MQKTFQKAKKALAVLYLTAKNIIMENTTMKQILCSKITLSTLLNQSKTLEVNARIIQVGNIKYII